MQRTAPTKSARAKDHPGVDLISDALPFGRLWYGEADAVVKFQLGWRSRQ
jgi:hypothetical protein